MSCTCHSHNGFLTVKGLAFQAAQQTSLEGLAPRGELGYLDKVGSVSALDEGRRTPMCDELIDQQYRRFLNAV